MNPQESRQKQPTAQDSLFDTLSRVLASPMPRRQALKLVLGSLAGTALMQWQMKPARSAPATSSPAFPGDLLVGDSSSGEVLRFNAFTGNSEGPFTGADGVGILSSPSGMAIGPDLNLYVSGYGNNSVLKYNGRTGTFLSVFASLGTPTGLAFGPDGDLYVANYSTNSIWRFNGSTGTFQDIFVNSGAGGLSDPQGLAFGPDGNLYVVSQGSNSILRCNVTTGAVSTFIPTGSGGLKTPTGLVFGKDGYLYVSSAGTNSVLRYNATTGVPASSAFVSSGSGGLSIPQGLGFGVDGNLYVVSQGSKNVLRFNGQSGAFLNVFAANAGNPYFLTFVPPSDSIYPNYGGNAGQVTVRITTDLDFSLVAGTQVQLSASGQQSIAGTNVGVITPHYLTTTFDLTGAAPGIYDVVLTLPNSTTRTIPQAFTVEQGGSAGLTTKVIGRSVLRAGIGQTYNISVSNTGNIDASAADLQFEFPSYFAWQLAQGTAQSVFTGPNHTSISVPLQTIPVGGTQIVQVKFTVPDVSQYAHKPFEIFAWTNPSKDTEITYIGDLSEPLFLRAETSDGKVMSLYGDTNLVTSILTQFADGNQVTILLDAQERPISIQGPNGVTIKIAWLSQAMIGVTVVFSDGTSYGPFNLEFASPVTTGGQAQPPGGPLAGPLASTNNQCPSPDDLNRRSIFVLTILALAAGLVSAFLATIPTLVVLSATAAGYLGLITFEVNAIGLFAGTAAALLGLVPSSSNASSSCGQTIVSGDPNDIAGTLGFGDPNWVPGPQPLQYAIFYGNEATASAAAQTVVITDKLDINNLDLKSFSLGPITFGTNLITPLPHFSPVLGVSEFDTTVDLRPANNLLVNVHASLNTDTGYLTWTFTSLDPSTGQPTDDPLAGFLPPGGEGSVLFTVNPKQNLPTGTAINDKATIVFDVNAPMDTPVWLNTLDNDPPVSQVAALSSTQNTSSFLVQWSGTDTINGVAGSGIQDFTIYVSDNGGAFTPWLVNTTDTSAQYTGVYGHTYAFSSQARDNAGNVEPAHTQADTRTRINAKFNLSGTVTLQSAVNKAQTLTFQFRPTDGSASFTQTVTLNSDGTFSLSAVPAMLFNLAIKGSKWLRKVIPVDGTSGDVSGVTATLLAGDVNGDNQVSLADYVLLRNAFGSRSTSSNWNANADLNCDGQVSLADYVLLRNNFGKKGDP